MRTHEYRLFWFPSYDEETVARHDTMNLSSLDEEVNTLLAEGWEILTTRIEPEQSRSDYYAAMVYFFCKRPLLRGGLSDAEVSAMRVLQ